MDWLRTPSKLILNFGLNCQSDDSGGLILASGLAVTTL